ncbi:serine hydrolase [Pedobacter sp. UBA4863]|mgnify:CR=1 FL=1|uniref:serine hydrolase domain-containing protein n=1 Tax=Pedobacter sp. UBA4863 TaxID=1947060 RepID=UPI0025F8B35A|nr:serine hydrolase domain-containing protein [Pedobacter sp. UBA4863]
MKKIFIALSCLFVLVSAGKKEIIISAKAQKIDSAITYLKLVEIAKTKTPAIQIAYLNNGKVEHYNYGVKSTTTAEPIDSKTIFQAASLSKVVATYAFLILADKGLLDLDKPLWKYYEYDRLKNDPNKELMTGRHVLTHQTGLVNWEAAAGSTAWKNSELKTRFTPGTDFTYSGEAYYYLQLVAEKITGKTLDQICTEYIFKPFGMKKSHYTFTNEIGKNITLAHRDDLTTSGRVQKFTEGNDAYTLYTTADEYMKFVIEGVLNGKGLSKKMYQEFLTPTVTTALKGKEKEKDKYVKGCLGIRIQENEAGTAYWHTGSNGSAKSGGFRCVFLVYPKSKKAITIFTNSSKGNTAFVPVLNQIMGKDQTYWFYKN